MIAKSLLQIMYANIEGGVFAILIPAHEAVSKSPANPPRSLTLVIRAMSYKKITNRHIKKFALRAQLSQHIVLSQYLLFFLSPALLPPLPRRILEH